MNISQAQAMRKVAGWITAALLFAALAFLADALASGFKGEAREFNSLPGMVIPVTSHFPSGATSLEEIRVLGGDQKVTLIPEGIFTGFWLGGNMWRGSIKIEAGATPGQRTFSIEPLSPSATARVVPPITFVVTVHETVQAMNRASHSFITRKFGINPYLACAVSFLLALPGVATVMLLSRKIEKLLTLEGKALVYMLKKSEDGPVIAFSFGSKQGLAPGMSVRIVNPAGQMVGVAQVNLCMPEDSTARIMSGFCEVGDMVLLPSADTPPSRG